MRIYLGRQVGLFALLVRFLSSKSGEADYSVPHSLRYGQFGWFRGLRHRSVIKPIGQRRITRIVGLDRPLEGGLGLETHTLVSASLL